MLCFASCPFKITQPWTEPNRRKKWVKKIFLFKSRAFLPSMNRTGIHFLLKIAGEEQLVSSPSHLPVEWIWSGVIETKERERERKKGTKGGDSMLLFNRFWNIWVFCAKTRKCKKELTSIKGKYFSKNIYEKEFLRSFFVPLDPF